MHLTQRFEGFGFLRWGHHSRRREVVDLLAVPTEALSRIRRKAGTGRALSRAEWTVVADVAQHGLETVAMTYPNRLSPDLFIAILDAFSAVYDVRTVANTRHDPYYLGNLPAECRPAAGIDEALVAIDNRTDSHGPAGDAQPLGNVLPGAEPYRPHPHLLARSGAPRHPDTAVILNNLGAVHLALRRFVEAEKYFRTALQMKRNLLGSYHHDVAVTLNNLAVLYARRGRRAKSLKFCEQAIAVFAKSLGPRHPRTRLCRMNYARLLGDKSARLQPRRQPPVELASRHHAFSSPGSNLLGCGASNRVGFRGSLQE